ncbi:MAG: hypothetical protein NTW62_02450 [Candidatus Nomurabacteria bacterium]|nr:hypothetical protein [Candidatus Nomurabacteria bacterium]
MDLKSLKLKLKSKTKFSSKKEFTLNSRLHWDIILYISGLLVVAALVFGFYFFMQANNDLDSLDSETIASKIETLNKNKIQKVLDMFSGREQKSIEILNSATTTPDPSI